MASSNSASWMSNSGRRNMTNSRMVNNHSRIESSVMQCHCGIHVALIKDGWYIDNEGIRFYSCPNTRGGRGGCGLFVWTDNENEQVVIIDLLRKMKVENESLMKEVHSMKKEVEEIMIIFKILTREMRYLMEFFFAEFGGCSLDAHHGYVVEYGIDRDTELGFHVDDSEVTLNVCIGREFSGGDLFFKGVRCDMLRVTPKSDHEPDSYEDLQSLEFGPLLFGSLERYLSLSVINTDRDVKV
ncbi:hypothetical protein ACFE04_026595 [Oxalis oulophora]